MKCEESRGRVHEMAGFGDQSQNAGTVAHNARDFPRKILLKTKELLQNARDRAAFNSSAPGSIQCDLGFDLLSHFVQRVCF